MGDRQTEGGRQPEDDRQTEGDEPATSYRVGILGGTGYVGSAIAATLEANGYDVTAAAGSTHERHPTVDLRDRAAVSAFVEDVDYVVNTAGIVGTDACADAPDLAFEINGLGAATVAWACSRRDVPLVHCSSVATIGVPERDPITADSRRAPATVYGETKLFGERAVQTITDGAVPSITYCLTNVYGRHESATTDHQETASGSVVDFFLERAVTDGHLPVHRPGTQERDLIHVGDVARAVTKAIDTLEDREPIARSHVLGSGTAYSVLELAGLVADRCRQATGSAPTLELRDRPETDQPVIDRFDVDTQPLAADIGFEPEHSVVDWIEGEIQRYDRLLE